MKAILLSFLTLIAIALADILWCNEKKPSTLRDPFYDNEFSRGLLFVFRVAVGILAIYLFFVSWKALIAVLLISLLLMRPFIDNAVEQLILVPALTAIFSFMGKRKR